ncbi:MAG: hypothetical protein GY908_00045 [Flavobacteriales bacterium]|nr:hypothetical protein [Flavobacteriales bacterium]
MKHLKKINILRFAIFQAVLIALIGIICGILYSFGGFFIDLFVSLGFFTPQSMSTPGLSFGTVLAFGALIGIPIIFAITGFLLGIVEAILYNLFTALFGSLNIDFR